MSRPPIFFQRTYVTLAAADLRRTYVRDTIVVDDTGAGFGDVPLQLPKIGTAYAPVGKRVTIVKPSDATHAVAITPMAPDKVSSGTPGAFPNFGVANSNALPAGTPGSVTLEATNMSLVAGTQPSPNGGTPTTPGAWLALDSGAGGGSSGGVQSVTAGTGLNDTGTASNPILNNTGVLSVTPGAGLTNTGTAADPILNVSIGAPSLSAVLAVGNDAGPHNILLPPAQQLDTDVAGTLKLGTTNATDIAIGAPAGSLGSPRLYINQGGTALHGSNNGVQVASAIANRGAFRANQYGNNSGVPGMTGFKSRGTFVGDLAAVAVPDVLWRATAVGVTGNNANIPLAGMISLNVEWVAAAYVAVRFAVQAVPQDGPDQNARREIFAVSSQGVPALQENVNRGAGLAILNGDGRALIPNTNADGIESRYTLTAQETAALPGGPNGRLFIEAHVDGVSFTIKSTAGGADQFLVVYWQMWNACEPGAISP